MSDAQMLREDHGMDADVPLNLDDVPLAPSADIVSMTRAMAHLRDALGLTNEQALAAMSKRLVGGIMPDLTLPQLEAIAAAGEARVCVIIETEDGRKINLAHLLLL